jgi:putative effector of murein hydrolase LrgA (UPF0299 family)
LTVCAQNATICQKLNEITVPIALICLTILFVMLELHYYKSSLFKAYLDIIKWQKIN